MNQYAGRFDLYHIDAYRLNSVAEFEMLGFDDFCYPESVVLIEWAERLGGNLPSPRVDVRIDITSDEERRITVERSEDSRQSV